MILNAAALAALFTSLKTGFNKGMESAPSMSDQVAMLIPSSSKQNDYSWMGTWPKLREWLGDKVVQNLEMHTYNIVNKDYESTIEVSRNDIEDDNLGVYAPLAEMEGGAAKSWPDENLFPLLQTGFTTGLCYDGLSFFNDSHQVGESTYSNTGGGSGTAWFFMDTTKPVRPLIFQQRKAPTFVAQDDVQSDSVFNRAKLKYGIEARGNFGFGLWQLCYGSKDTLDATNYAAARAAMMAYKDEHGRSLNVMPNVLVVPPALEANAREIVEKQNLSGGESNIWFNTAQVLVVSWLA